MSMNLYLLAFLPAETRLGKKVIRESCDLWQTSTDVTRKILKSDNIFDAYKEWILSRSYDRMRPVYADDDIFNEREPVGTEIINYGRDHIADVKEWLDDHKGWDIKWSEL